MKGLDFIYAAPGKSVPVSTVVTLSSVKLTERC